MEAGNVEARSRECGGSQRVSGKTFQIKTAFRFEFLSLKNFRSQRILSDKGALSSLRLSISGSVDCKITGYVEVLALTDEPTTSL